jgi:hypothetical protein
MAVVAVLSLAATTMIGVTSASATALTDTTWSVSNNQTGATAVTYTFELTTATSGTIKTVTATVPANTGGTVAAGQIWGLGAGAATLSGTTLTYTVTVPETVAAGIPLYIEFTGLTNTTTATASATSTVTTNDATPTTIDTATSSPSVSFGAASTAVTVQIPKSLTFTNDTPSFTMQLDPSLTALSTVSKAVTVTVTTNAGQGYTLAAKDTGLISGSNTITFASTGVATGVASASFAANTIGVSATKTIAGGSLAAIQGAGLAVSGNYVGYTTGGETFLSASKPTGNTADSLVLTNRVKIDYNTPAGTYTDTITYTATPSY